MSIDQQSELEALRAELASLRAEHEELASTVERRDVEVVEPEASRRGLFKLAAGAAAGGAAAIVMKGTPVAAGDGDPINAGETTSSGDLGRNTTVLRYTNANPPQVPRLFQPGQFDPANIMTVRDGLLAAFFNQNSSNWPAAVGGYARSTVANGVYGLTSNGGFGVVGQGIGVGAAGVRAEGVRANIELDNAGDAPSARTDAHVRGELVADTNGALWYCVAAGTPGTWTKLADATTAGSLHPLPTPVRCYDSRAGEPPLGVTKGKLLPGTSRVVDTTFNSTGVPTNARGVMLNLTVANTTGLGNMAVYPDGGAAPSTSTINYVAGINVANSTFSGCGPGAKVRVQCGGATGADFIIDILGYFL